MKNIAIIGTGSWGTALAIHLDKMGNNIKMWSYEQEEIRLMNDEHVCKFLPGIQISNSIKVSGDYKEVVENSDYIFHVTPSKATRDTMKQYRKYVSNQPIIICSKGFENSTYKTLDEIAKEEFSDTNNTIIVLSGPSHAEEVAKEVPTAMVLASEDNEKMLEIQNLLMNEKMRVYLSNDVKGTELGGALKNIIAICSGIISGMQLGDNVFAALITRGLAEISRLGVELGGKKDTFYGLSGLGDLIVTCSSNFSRNRRAGILIGQGKTIEETKKEVGMVIEGIENIQVAYDLSNKYNVEMPIVKSVYNVLYNGLNPNDAIRKLMLRSKKFE